MLGRASAWVNNPTPEMITPIPKIEVNIVEFEFFTAAIQHLGFGCNHQTTIFIFSLQIGNWDAGKSSHWVELNFAGFLPRPISASAVIESYNQAVVGNKGY